MEFRSRRRFKIILNLIPLLLLSHLLGCTTATDKINQVGSYGLGLAGGAVLTARNVAIATPYIVLTSLSGGSSKVGIDLIKDSFGTYTELVFNGYKLYARDRGKKREITFIDDGGGTSTMLINRNTGGKEFWSIAPNGERRVIPKDVRNFLNKYSDQLLEIPVSKN